MKYRLAIYLLSVSGIVSAQSNTGDYIWPVGVPLHQGTYISNYKDAASSAQVQDYGCSADHSYDGHKGIDIAALTMRQFDLGVPIVAAKGGTVTFTQYNQFDRNYWPPYIESGNGVFIDQDDGHMGIYWHLRENSIVVEPGERVEAGDLLAYMGSSGSTPIPHLHFQINTSVDDNSNIDPFAGSCVTGQTVWANPPDYVADDPLRILDFGLFTDTSFNGFYQSGELKTLKDQPEQPAIFGLDQPSIGVWVQLQGNFPQPFDIRLVKPDGSEFAREQIQVDGKRRYAWYTTHFPLANTSAADIGNWTLEVSNPARGMSKKTFSVNTNTEYGPRFYPLAGRSFRLNGQAQNYMLSLSENSPDNIQLNLQDAPNGVSLQGANLVLAADINLQSRHHEFHVVATDSKGNKDRFHVQLVDPNQARTAAEDFLINRGITGAWANSEVAGQGYLIDVIPDREELFVALFTYDADEDTGPDATDFPDHRWYTAQGSYTGNQAELNLFLTEGGNFETNDATTTTAIGTLTLQFDNCGSGSASYTIPEQNLSNAFTINKLVVGELCDQLATGGAQ